MRGKTATRLTVKQRRLYRRSPLFYCTSYRRVDLSRQTDHRARPAGAAEAVERGARQALIGQHFQETAIEFVPLGEPPRERLATLLVFLADRYLRFTRHRLFEPCRRS